MLIHFLNNIGQIQIQDNRKNHKEKIRRLIQYNKIKNSNNWWVCKEKMNYLKVRNYFLKHILKEKIIMNNIKFLNFLIKINLVN